MEPHSACSTIQRSVWRRVDAWHLAQGARVLDAPCGAGHLAASLLEAGFDVTGADIDSDAFALLGGRFRHADLNEPLPWPDGHFDAALSIEGIEHLENHYAYLRELHRVLKDDGLLILTTPNIQSVRSRVRFLGSGFFHQDPRPLREPRHPLHHIGLATLAELRYELRTSGFQVIDVRQTHMKPVAYLYGLFVPWMWLYTLIAFRKEHDPHQRAQNRDLRAILFSSSVLFGENLMLTARKIAG